MGNIRPDMRVRRVDVPTYTVDDSSIRRYDQSRNVLRRIWHDPDFPGYMM